MKCLLSHAKVLAAGLVLAAISLTASAQIGTLSRTSNGGFTVTPNTPQSYTVGNVTGYPPTGTWHPPAGSGTVSFGNVGIGPNAAGTGPQVSSRGEVPVSTPHGRVNVPVDVTAPVSKPSAAAAIGKFVGKILTPLAYGMAVYDLAHDLGFTVGTKPDGSPKFSRLGPDACASNCWTYASANAPGQTFSTQSAACHATYANWPGVAEGGIVYKGEYSVDPNDDTLCYGALYNSAGQSPSWVPARVGKIAPRDPDQPSEVALQEFIDEIANKSGWPSSASRALADALKSGESAQTGPSTVTGPASVPGPSSSKQEPLPDGTGTKTTVTTTTINNTYNNNTWNSTVTTQSTSTYVYNNGTPTKVETTTEESDPEQEDTGLNDTANPERPKLYERKYRDGLSGVWTTQKAAFDATPIGQLKAQLMPTIPDGGSCPSWMLSLNFQVWNFGDHDVAPPCWVWDFGEVVIVLSALLLARALIFGG